MHAQKSIFYLVNWSIGELHIFACQLSTLNCQLTACFFACLFFEFVLHRQEIVVPLQCQKKGIKITPTRGGKKFPRALKSFASRSSKKTDPMTMRK